MPTDNYRETTDDIRLRPQPEVDAILGYPPGWLLRSGITAVAILIGVILLLSWVVKYPDIIEAPAVITSTRASIPLVAKKSEKIDELYFDDQAYVRFGDIIGRIHDVADYESIRALDQFVHQFDLYTVHPTEIELIDFNPGNLQSSYGQLIQASKAYNYEKNLTLVDEKILALHNEIQQILLLNQSLQIQEGLLNTQYQLSLTKFDRHQQLLSDGVISQQDMEEIEVSHVQMKQQIEQFKSNRLNNEVRIKSLETQIVELQSNRDESLARARFQIEQRLDQLKSELQEWKNSHLVIAPSDGRLMYMTVRRVDEPVQQGQALFAIIPQVGHGE